MSQHEPRSDDPPYIHECVDCGNREDAEHSPGDCEKCGGETLNVSVTRDE